MSLTTYRAKRTFKDSPEPQGEKDARRGPLRFVVQMHHARRLHFDFRLELDGVLKSWAVPKGPSLNPTDKRLAIQVEDHPLDYAAFEGVIPKGNYGAGTVIVWDHGAYQALNSSSRADSEQKAREGLAKGHLSVILHGQKLRGEFALVKTSRGNPKAWLLIKKRDVFASDADGLDDARSVASSRTLTEIAKAEGDHRLARLKPVELDLSGIPKGPMPHRVKPMLATPITQAFDHPNWIFEIKWDGYRAVAEVEKRRVRFYSRRQLSFEERYAPIVETLKHLEHDAVLDGEVVALDQAGKAQFQLLQEYQSARRGHLVYYVFDLLWLDGHDLRDAPLLRRKELLTQLVAGLANIKVSEHVEASGKAFFHAIKEQGLEGMVAKEGKSRYREGIRGKSWLKMRTHLRQEAVIGGFTKPQGSRKYFGALVLGVYRGNELVYIGSCGSGFDQKSLADVHARLEPMVQAACPFKKRPDTSTPAHWLTPQLVCEISFAGWTDDGHVRFPVFVGLREDKSAASVQREDPQPVTNVVAPAPASGVKSTGPTRLLVNGRPLQVTNLRKVFWPAEGYTKGDLIDYYRAVAPTILPYLRDRPQSLNRHPNGIEGKNFFQKDASRQPPPDWIQTVVLPTDSRKRETIRYFVCQEEATLVYLANLGCIELNLWGSRLPTLDRPDYLAIDLDPEDIEFDEVVRTAQTIRQVLDQFGIEGLCKTSGKRGLHIYVPLGAAYPYEQARQFAELIAALVHQQLRQTTSLFRLPKQRQQRVYLDCLQNGRGKTLAAPYSVRPYPGATVSTPLEWREVKKGLDPSRFTIRTLPGRIDKIGDLWEPILGPGIDLQACLERLAKQLKIVSP